MLAEKDKDVNLKYVMLLGIFASALVSTGHAWDCGETTPKPTAQPKPLPLTKGTVQPAATKPAIKKPPVKPPPPPVKRFPRWKVLGGSLKQVDVGPFDSVWGVNKHDGIFMLNGRGWVHIPGGLMHVSTGDAGVWGVNRGHRIYYRHGITLDNPKGRSWKLLSGRLIQIDSGPLGIVYGVNKHHHIFCRTGISNRNPLGVRWIRVPGGLKYVSCGRFGCWGVNGRNFIYFRHGVTPHNCRGTRWVHIPGRLRQLEVDSLGNLYGVNVGKRLYVRTGITPHRPTGTGWRHIPTRPFVHVSAGYSTMLALNTKNQIYYFQGCFSPRSGPLTRISGGLKQIDHGLSTGVWGVNRHDQIWRLKDNKAWQFIPGGLKHVSSGQAGVWGVNKFDNIYYRVGVCDKTPAGNSWRHIPGKLKQIDSGPGQIVYGVNSGNQIFCRTGIDFGQPSGTGWKHVPGGLKYISCGETGCWGVNRHNHIWYRAGISNQNCAGTRWIRVPGGLRQIEVGINGDVYGINRLGQVWRRLGITELKPLGVTWRRIYKYASHITTGLKGRYMLIRGAIYESLACQKSRGP